MLSPRDAKDQIGKFSGYRFDWAPLMRDAVENNRPLKLDPFYVEQALEYMEGLEVMIREAYDRMQKLGDMADLFLDDQPGKEEEE